MFWVILDENIQNWQETSGSLSWHIVCRNTQPLEKLCSRLLFAQWRQPYPPYSRFNRSSSQSDLTAIQFLASVFGGVQSWSRGWQVASFYWPLLRPKIFLNWGTSQHLQKLDRLTSVQLVDWVFCPFKCLCNLDMCYDSVLICFDLHVS